MWQDEWPTQPGYWWFYGWCWRKIRDKPEEPEMHLVEVRKISNGVMYVTKGHFLHREEGAEGKWMKAELPTPPKGIKARKESKHEQ